MTAQAVVKKGQLVLDKPLDLPDGARVSVEIAPIDAGDEHPLLWAARHAVDTGIPDLAEEHDHYAYGTPKRKSRKK